jgi:hypothetical protein
VIVRGKNFRGLDLKLKWRVCGFGEPLKECEPMPTEALEELGVGYLTSSPVRPPCGTARLPCFGAGVEPTLQLPGRQIAPNCQELRIVISLLELSYSQPTTFQSTSICLKLAQDAFAEPSCRTDISELGRLKLLATQQHTSAQTDCIYTANCKTGKPSARKPLLMIALLGCT